MSRAVKAFCRRNTPGEKRGAAAPPPAGFPPPPHMGSLPFLIHPQDEKAQCPAAPGPGTSLFPIRRKGPCGGTGAPAPCRLPPPDTALSFPKRGPAPAMPAREALKARDGTTGLRRKGGHAAKVHARTVSPPSVPSAPQACRRGAYPGIHRSGCAEKSR